MSKGLKVSFLYAIIFSKNVKKRGHNAFFFMMFLVCETLYLPLYAKRKCMEQNIFRLVLTDEAQNFIESLPEAVSYKIYYNIKRVAGGERNKELFKKLENSEIWEFRTLYNKTA